MTQTPTAPRAVLQIDNERAARFYGFESHADMIYWGRGGEWSTIEKLAKEFARHREQAASTGEVDALYNDIGLLLGNLDALIDATGNEPDFDDTGIIDSIRQRHKVRAALPKPAAEPGVNVRMKAGLNTAILDASWGRLKVLLQYKIEKAGGRYLEVDPRHTSQICSGCGSVVHKRLDERTHSCGECGLTLDRDVNAARNVLHAAVHGRGAAKVGGCAMPSPGKAVA